MSLNYVERANLRQFMIDHFDILELKVLAFNLGVDFQLFSHETKEDLSINLILYHERRSNLSCLVTEMLKQRPNNDLVQLITKLPPCSPFKKVIVILPHDHLDNLSEFITDMATKCKVNKDEVSIIGAVWGSINLLIKLPSKIDDWSVLLKKNNKYNISLVVPFNSLTSFDQTLWQRAAIEYPPLYKKDNSLHPVISWQEIQLLGAHALRSASPPSHDQHSQETRSIDSIIPFIDNRTGQNLDDIIAIFREMFVGYPRVVIHSEFKSGLSRGRVFVVRPILVDGAEIPSVVKVDDAARTRQEYAAYHKFVQNRLAKMAEVRGKPVYPSGLSKGGIWYSLIGSGEFTISSLHEYFVEAPLENIRFVLENQLFKTLETLWRQAQRPYAGFNFQDYYDFFLPMNLVVEKASPPEGVSIYPLNPQSVRSQNYQVDNYVEIEGFSVVNINPEHKNLSLDTPTKPIGAYRFSLKGMDDWDQYKLDQQLPKSITGVIRETRSDLLLKEIHKIFGKEHNFADATLSLPNYPNLPNPLLKLPEILKRPVDVLLGTIHGDLNLQNVLIETDSRSAYLIDFAQSRRDHVLRDLFHLEMSIVTKLIPEQLVQINLKSEPERIIPFYEQLHCAWLSQNQISPYPELKKPFAILQIVRKMANNLLYKSGFWQEYYYGLFIYLIGSLRYGDLDKPPLAPLPKQVAFWGAAAILSLLQQPLNCADYIPPQIPPEAAQSPSPKQSTVNNTTHFYGPVAGPIHTGSGNIQIETMHIEQSSTPTFSPLPRYKPEHRIALLKILRDIFNVSELQDLCLELGVDYDNLAGSSKADKARELLLYCERRGLSDQLVHISYQQRPNINWDPFK